MSEENNNQNDLPTEKQKNSDETHAELREISKEELKQILEEHKKWLESDEKEGKRADLSRANLQKADLMKANLQKTILFKANLENTNLQKAILFKANLQDAFLFEANLQDAFLFEANLQDANLEGANLQNADLLLSNLQNADLLLANLRQANLSEANLQGANLKNADMQNTVLSCVKGFNEANLQYANLEGATGLLGNEFAQADVTGTKLPKKILEFKSLQIVEETSKIARNVFIIMLLACVYSWMTIFSTNDPDLLTNSPYSPPPITGAKIPLAGFYLYVPIFLVGFYVYLNFYLQRLWRGLAGLPSIFPDGKRLDEMAYPWLLNGLVCRHFRLLKRKTIISHSEESIIIYLVWWVVPFTMIGFWLRYLPRHDWFGTCFHIGLIVLSVALAILFYRLCALTLQGKEKTVFRLKNIWRDRRFYYSVCVVVGGILFSLFSYGAINGERSDYPNVKDINKFVPWVFKIIGYDVFADFREKVVSELPTNYGAIAKEERVEYVKGANLKGTNLKNADMYKAFLVKADLRGALLNGANLRLANLQQANLKEAILQEANLLQANLQQADLWRANLQGADLSGANLQQAKLWGANLEEAYLRRANLEEVYLRRANLQQTSLWFANLQQADLELAILWQAKLRKANLQQANLGGANLQQANLWGANLQQADLRNAKLQQANFKDADLENTHFGLADLAGAKNLTIDQLSKVKTLYQAKLNTELMEQVKRCCPHLLEKPKEEKNQKDETD